SDTTDGNKPIGHGTNSRSCVSPTRPPTNASRSDSHSTAWRGPPNHPLRRSIHSQQGWVDFFHHDGLGEREPPIGHHLHKRSWRRRITHSSDTRGVSTRQGPHGALRGTCTAHRAGPL